MDSYFASVGNVIIQYACIFMYSKLIAQKYAKLISYKEYSYKSMYSRKKIVKI